MAAPESTFASRFKFMVAYTELQNEDCAERTAIRAQPGAKDFKASMVTLDRAVLKLEETLKRFTRINKILATLPNPLGLSKGQGIFITKLESELAEKLREWLHGAEERIAQANDHVQKVNSSISNDNSEVRKQNVNLQNEVTRLTNAASKAPGTVTTTELEAAKRKIKTLEGQLRTETKKASDPGRDKEVLVAKEIQLRQDREDAWSKVKTAQQVVTEMAQAQDTLTREIELLCESSEANTAESATRISRLETEAGHERRDH
jgi:chromosome segregation ATPase